MCSSARSLARSLARKLFANAIDVGQWSDLCAKNFDYIQDGLPAASHPEHGVVGRSKNFMAMVFDSCSGVLQAAVLVSVAIDAFLAAAAGMTGPRMKSLCHGTKNFATGALVTAWGKPKPPRARNTYGTHAGITYNVLTSMASTYLGRYL